MTRETGTSNHLASAASLAASAFRSRTACTGLSPGTPSSEYGELPWAPFSESAAMMHTLHVNTAVWQTGTGPDQGVYAQGPGMLMPITAPSRTQIYARVLTLLKVSRTMS